MHSSIMRTACSLSYRGSLSRGVFLDRNPPWTEIPLDRDSPDIDHPGQIPPTVNRMTHASKNITLPQTSFAGGNNCKFILWTLHCRLAHSASEQHREALECYRKALELDPSNASYQQNIEIAEQKVRETVRCMFYLKWVEYQIIWSYQCFNLLKSSDRSNAIDSMNWCFMNLEFWWNAKLRRFKHGRNGLLTVIEQPSTHEHGN